MELRQLEYFVAVAEEANFTRAADRVHISQPGISAQIKALEAEIGQPLFDRSARVARLTAAGKAALEPARAALAAATAVRDAVDAVAGLLRGNLSIGMVTGCTITPLFVAVEAFRDAHPDVRLSMRENDSATMLSEVQAGDLDVAIVGTAGAPPEALESMTIVSEPLAALVPGGHRWSGRRSLDYPALAGQPLVTMPDGTGVRATLETGCAQHGFMPTVAVQASAADSIADLCARGVGIGVLSASMAQEHADRLAVVPMRGNPVPAVLAVVWRPTPSPAVAAFLPRLAAAFGR
ncbi:LysR family transcriptional regulator [Mycobacterium sp. MS1601]|uniref:LysR family transcriptional regulator n=1 Tax=Mycobacterium sp. MS1601 TaxID=1936029 RepID=UPI00097950B7|nr:LysR family transcriptional regulator [Mycobacterium sp. MS1601]AQA05283.1 LysR family transcriptional regulator [Mycobacterium sp. MS1601]